MKNSKTLELFESFKNEFEKEPEVINESEKLEEKINKDNIEINKAIANPNLGKNKDKIKAAGYDTKEDYDGKTYMIQNPKTGKSVNPFAYDKEGKQKVDFKGKLDSERPYTGKVNVYDTYAGKGRQIPNRAIVGKDKRGNAIANAEDFDAYSAHTSMIDDKSNYKSISQNVNDYKQAVKDRDEKADRAERDKRGLSYYEDKVKRAQEDLDREKKYIENNEKGSKAAEDRRKEIIANIRARKNKANESEEFLKESEDFEDKLKALYNSYRQDGMEDAFWSDLMNCIDNLEYLNQWYDSLNESESLKESSKYNSKSKEEFEDIEDFKSAINDDINTINGNLENLKYKMNTDDSVEVLEGHIATIRSDLLDKAYNN